MRPTLVVLFLGLMTLGASSCGSGGGGSANARTTSANGRTTQVTFVVTGSAPKGASIIYGRDDTDYKGHFPLHTTLPLFSRAGYYFLSAQLKNGGNITCTLGIGTASKVVHARSGHKACSARLTNDYQGGWH
jgi:hypothetical protein